MTEATLNGMNKGQVVATALSLIAKLDTLSSGPITSDRIKAEMLNLKREGLDIVERRENAKNELTKALAEIEANKERAIAELQLKFNANDGVDADALNKSYEDLEAKSIKAIKDLTFGLEKAENDANIEMAKIQEKIDIAQKKYDDLVADTESKANSLRTRFAEEVNKTTIEHTRKMDQLSYDQSIALRDENMKFIKSAADNLNFDIVDKAELQNLKDFKAKEESELATALEDAVKEAKSSVYAAEGAKLNALKSQKDTEIALLQNDNKHLQTTITSQASRIADLEARLKDVPTQIAEAVKAAQSSVTVNQDSTKK